MVNKYWLSIKPCGCLEGYWKDDGSILPPGEVNDFVKKAVAMGNRTELQECLPGEYPFRKCDFHWKHEWPFREKKEKEVNMVNKITECPHKTLRDWPDCYQDCDFNNSYDCPNGGTEAIKEGQKKEVNMVHKITQEYMGTGANPENTLQPGEESRNAQTVGGKIFSELQPKRRGRKPKDNLDGIEVITTRTAIIPLHIPKRPVGMEKVFIRVLYPDGPMNDIEWPKDWTAKKAILEWAEKEVC